MFSGIIAAWREVRAIVLGLSVLLALAIVTKRRVLTLTTAAFLGWIFYFFRNPERLPASASPEWILSPADGKVTHIEMTEDPYFFKGQAQRISMFLSLFDVHLQRNPYQGTVRFLRYQSGSFAPAFLRNTEENEYNYIGLETPHGLIGVKQIAGILARRIVCWANLDEPLATGQRLGLIKFGSRVDLYLPPNAEILVHIGQQLHGSQTIVARWHNETPGSNPYLTIKAGRI